MAGAYIEGCTWINCGTLSMAHAVSWRDASARHASREMLADYVADVEEYERSRYVLPHPAADISFFDPSPAPVTPPPQSAERPALVGAWYIEWEDAGGRR